MRVTLAVVGAHLLGEPLNWQLTSQGARLLETTLTAPDYRLYALPGDDPAQPSRPGLVAGDPAGAPIEVELWELSAEALGRLLVQVPSPLAIGTVRLRDGRTAKGFLCEAWATREAADITRYGGWRAYRRATGP
jgi:allophanate hydrolase